jgi:CRP-like cAMP-binding protein
MSTDKIFDKMLNLITENIKIEYVNPEDKIISQNDEFDGNFYFVYKGCFEVSATKYGHSDGR